MSHEPQVLFLDEPTAGVDVNLRKDMWNVVRELRKSGVTIILTTHYIEEAQDMADRVGVISNGELILVEEKNELMRKMGKKQLALHLQQPLGAIPASLAAYDLMIADNGNELVYTYDTQGERTGITRLLHDLNEAGVRFNDLQTTQSSLEEIFVSLVSKKPAAGGAVMNWHAVRAIYYFEMARTGRTLMQSIVSPVLSTSLYFVVFGAAIGSRITEIDGVPYGAFIVPGLIMLTLLTQSVAERVVRNLFSAIHRHDLRTSLRADIVFRNRARLCRRRRDQVDHPRTDHSRHRLLLRADPDRTSALDGRRF